MDEDITQAPKYWLPSEVYTALKWAGLAALPTLSWVYQALAAVWSLPFANEISATLGIVGTCIAVLIGASSLAAAKGQR